eukprot:TRINITY_DN49909_c0_g1_i1.p1 TRINITY_DN49909_c0_g1~~TRINITY_DN49909_c0_g1_i1.p1  ORF type:complete len:977 (+),score=324.34 TRINITY_DN49909_c0_g1_i1:107-2932(+)
MPPPKDAIEVGCSVVCKGRHATVRYVGPLQHVKGDWVGLQFDEPGVGNHDGSVSGKRYFDCPAGHGLFVRAGTVFPDCAPTGQNHLQVLQTWNAIEAGGESDFLRSNSGLGHVAEALMQGAHSQQKQQDLAVRRLHRRKSQIAAEEEPGPEYKGPRLKFTADGKIDQAQVDRCIDHFKKNPNVPLAAVYLIRLIEEARRLFAATSAKAVQDLKIPPVEDGGRIVVCGDVHGQLADLYWVFFKHRYPAPDNIFVMNGDIADRGEYAVECFVLLFLHKVLHPNAVFINKGNHEDDYMNTRYGFHAEVKRKYGVAAGRVYQAFQGLFLHLPLGTVLDNEVLIIHGGLSRKQVRLDQLRAVRHVRVAPDCPGRSLDDTLFYDALWSDPRDQPGVGYNPRGGDVIAFGPDISRNFLAKSNLKMLIRSHQVPEAVDAQGFPRGFEWHHAPVPKGFEPLSPVQQGLVLTVFTASNYCGTVANLGAVVIFRHGQGQRFEVLEHYANDLAYLVDVEKETIDATEQMKRAATSEVQRRTDELRQAAGRMQRDVMERVKSEIVRHKHELFEYWWAVDPEKDLHVPLEVWKEAMDTIVTSEIDWADMAQKLGVVTDQKLQLVNYTHFLARFQIRFKNKFGLHAGFRRAITDRAFEALLLADLSMRETFAVLDRNDDGLVSIHEFQTVLESSGVGLTRPQIQALSRTIVAHASHPDSGGRIKIEDFLGRLQLRYRATHAKAADPATEWVPEFLPRIAKEMLIQQQRLRAQGEMGQVLAGDDRVSMLTEWFHRADKDQTGFLSPEELTAALKLLQCCKEKTPEELATICAYVNVVGNEHINYLEFLNAFHLEDKSGPELAEDVLEYIYRLIHFEFEIPLLRTFRSQDPEHIGRITKQQFQECVQAVNSTRQPPDMTPQQIHCLVDTLSLSEDGTIDYEDWLNSFEIVDTLLDESY